jgi:hypothetical protein
LYFYEDAMDQKKRRRAALYQHDDIQDRMNEYGPGRPGGPLGFAPKRKGRPTGRLALIRRLRRDHPDLHQQVLAGELTPHRAAIAAGFLRKPREPKPPVSAIGITPLQEMDLWLGPSYHGSAFSTDQERRRLWAAHRERIMEYWGQDGRRPQAWWRYDAPHIPYPGYARERSALFEAGLLTKSEAKALTAEWRAEFQRASQPNFFFTTAPGEILQGEAARQKHFAWADIPTALVQQWEAARQRAG